MEMTATQSNNRLSLVSPHQVSGTVAPSAPEQLGPRVLELTGLLQTTLDLKELMVIFAREIQRSVAIDGFEYLNPEGELEIQQGKMATHRATYDLIIENENLGATRIYRNKPFIERELRGLENLLCALVYPLRNALAYRRVLERASRDPLTGAQNREALEQALVREVELSHRQGTELAALVIDIDHFKSFNDKYGHSFGDEVIKFVSETIETSMRTSDLHYRFGGEEFVVLASHTDREGAHQLAERIRQTVESLQHLNGCQIELTVSIGVTNVTINDDPRSLFDRADKALYQAKNSGRNRVIVR